MAGNCLLSLKGPQGWGLFFVQGRKQFFFVKKNQKTFDYYGVFGGFSARTNG
jgi:hypothetical protein